MDLPRLESRFKSLQRVLHPDRWATRGASDRSRSAALAARLNVAYACLRDPLPRARYLLQLAAAGDAAPASAAHSGGREEEEEAVVVACPELLSEVLEMREAVEEAGVGPEAAWRLRQLQGANAASRGACLGAMGDAFREGRREAAKAEVSRLAYLDKLDEEIRSRLP